MKRGSQLVLVLKRGTNYIAFWVVFNKPWRLSKSFELYNCKKWKESWGLDSLGGKQLCKLLLSRKLIIKNWIQIILNFVKLFGKQEILITVSDMKMYLVWTPYHWPPRRFRYFLLTFKVCADCSCVTSTSLHIFKPESQPAYKSFIRKIDCTKGMF